MSNVVVVVLDTVRARETVPADPRLTPTLARLAEEGTEFTRAFTPAPWSLPSHASLVTGTYPSRHGAHAASNYLDDALPTLGELFSGAGYETVAISNNAWVTEEFGFGRGFDTFHEDFDAADRTRVTNDDGERAADGRADDMVDKVDDLPRAPPPIPNTLVDTPLAGLWHRLSGGTDGHSLDDGARRTVERVRKWLANRPGDDPFYLFLNVIDAHLPYRPPREYAERHLPAEWSYERAMEIPQDPRRFDVEQFTLGAEEWSVLRALYRAEIEYVDAQLGRLRAALEAAGEWADTTLVVTSDHGENVGEHGLLGHQYCLYDTLLHVPLVIAGGEFDGRRKRGDRRESSGRERRDDRLVSLVDLAPTLLDDASVQATRAREEFQGRSVHPSADAPRRRHVFAEYFGPPLAIERLAERFQEIPDHLSVYRRSLRAVRTERHKYVRGSDGSVELYDLRSDPGENREIAEATPDVVEKLGRDLDEWTASFEQATADDSISIEPSTRQRLSDLGYL